MLWKIDLYRKTKSTYLLDSIIEHKKHFRLMSIPKPALVAPFPSPFGHSMRITEAYQLDLGPVCMNTRYSGHSIGVAVEKAVGFALVLVRLQYGDV